MHGIWDISDHIKLKNRFLINYNGISQNLNSFQKQRLKCKTICQEKLIANIY